MKSSALLLSLLFPFAALAADPITVQIDQPVAQGAFSVGVGSKVSILLPGQSDSHAGLFLGKVTAGDGSTDSFMFWDETANTVDYVPANLVQIPDDGLQNIFKLYDQAGDTCTAYAIYDFLEQLHQSGFVGNGALAQTLSTEKGRTQLLVDAVSQYYLEPQHQNSASGILNGFGKQYGFSCKAKFFQGAESIRTFILSRLAAGFPVPVGFWIGPDMFNAPTKMIDFANPSEKVDNRLWIPRQIGERNSGGHTVVAVASFVENGHLQLLMLDSDWDAPRIWDFDKIFVAKTAFKEIEFDACD